MPELALAPADPRTPEAAALIRELSHELARRYDFIDDGSGDFKPEDALVPGGVFLVGRVGGRAVACGAVRPTGEAGVCEVKRMFVAPDCRGRGYSRAVLAELERLAAGMGYRVARLETGDRQPEAIALYQRANYRRVPNFGIYAGVEISLCFEKELAPAPGAAG